MSWINDHKGAGPWNFIEQYDKWGYLNNPRWSAQLDAQKFCNESGLPNLKLNRSTHEPCGHWHKRKPGYTAESLIIRLLSCGKNNHGQLGLGTSGTVVEGVADFVQFGADTWNKAAAGFHFSLAIKSDGTLWATGENGSGQLGLGDTVDRDEWEQVGVDDTWIDVACGRYFSMAIRSDGTLWGTGGNNYGQLGLNDLVQRTSFTQVAGTSWERVECGHTFSVARKTDDTLWSTGYNFYGQLGLGNHGFGTNRDEFEQIGSDTNWDDFSAGDDHMLAIKTTGTLWATGRDWYGECGLNYTQTDTMTQVGVDTTWIDVACGGWHTIAVKSNGSLWGTGSDYYGQLGLNNGEGLFVEYAIFTQISASDYQSVFCGSEHSMAIKTDGVTWGTGRNEYGQQGRGDYGIKYVFTEILPDFSDIAGGNEHTIVVKDDGTMWVTGDNYTGALGIAEHWDYTDIFTALEGEDWRQVDTWSYHSLAVKQDVVHAAHGCGDNRYGQLGQDDYNSDQYDNLRWKLIEIQILNIEVAPELWLSNTVCGHKHTAVLDSDGHIWTFGSNTYGQLCLGDTTWRWSPVKVSEDVYKFIAAGSYATMAILADGSLWVCGRNSGSQSGQLGLNDIIDRHVLTKVTVPVGTWTQVSIGN